MNKCIDCKKFDDCTEHRGSHKYCFVPDNQTNYERIKNMSVEEMAQFITDCKPFCTLHESDCIYGWHGCNCEKHAKEWLESEDTE